MRVWLLLLVALVAAVAVGRAQRINEAELNNDVLVRKRFNCVLDRGPCDKTGNALKAAIPDILGRRCQKCTPQQKATSQRIAANLMRRYPNEWAQVRAKYHV